MNTLEQLIDDMRTVALAEAGALTLKLAADRHWRGRSTTRWPPSSRRQRPKGVTLGSRLSARAARALADEQRVGQVLTNLLSNALCGTRRRAAT